ncbi:MAG: hypothetical protein JZU55_10935, partial [Afipia sp.]|nr:hypothetical protein [Afipia sp.]
MNQLAPSEIAIAGSYCRHATCGRHNCGEQRDLRLGRWPLITASNIDSEITLIGDARRLWTRASDRISPLIKAPSLISALFVDVMLDLHKVRAGAVHQNRFIRCQAKVFYVERAFSKLS